MLVQARRRILQDPIGTNARSTPRRDEVELRLRNLVIPRFQEKLRTELL